MEVIEGEPAGARVLIRNGLTIGRRESSLTLRDAKVSGRHARVEQRSDGFWLIDVGSSNGIKINGNRVLEAKLELGLELILGKSTLRVVARRGKTPSTPEPVSPNDIEIDPPLVNPGDDGLPFEPRGASQPPKPEPPKIDPKKQWQELMAALIQRARSEGVSPKRTVAAFHAPMRMRFIRGIQTGQEWIVAYGPRDAGADSFDLSLEEPGLPGLCFRLLPQHDTVLLKVESPELVRLNGNSVESAFLQDGDVIEIKNTWIQIEFDQLQG